MSWEGESGWVDQFGPPFHGRGRKEGLVVIMSWRGGGRGLELTCFVANSVTGHAVRCWQQRWAKLL
jgi:hypothetical protein